MCYLKDLEKIYSWFAQSPGTTLFAILFGQRIGVFKRTTLPARKVPGKRISGCADPMYVKVPCVWNSNWKFLCFGGEVTKKIVMRAPFVYHSMQGAGLL